MKRVYLAGPMNGIPEHNVPEFTRVSALLRAASYGGAALYYVVSPHEMNLPAGQSWDFYLRANLQMLVTCEAIAVMAGYRLSRGAMLELTVAHALGLEIVEIPGEQYSRDSMERFTKARLVLAEMWADT